MPTILDNLTDNIKTWTSSAANRASKITKLAANKAEELGKVGRLKMEVYQLQRQRQRSLGDLGKVAYSLIKNKTAPDDLVKSEGVEKLMTRLTDLNTKIKQKEAEIEVASTQTARQTAEKVPSKAIAVAPNAASPAKSPTAGSSKSATAKPAKKKVTKSKVTPKKPASKSVGTKRKAAAKKGKSSAESKS